jgi:maltose O-acetyltransferase
LDAGHNMHEESSALGRLPIDASERRSELQKMLAGGTFLAPDDECDAVEARATALLDELNATPMSLMKRRIAILQQALIRYEPGLLKSPVRWQYGHIEIGAGCFFNWDCIFLDNAPIRFGTGIAVGPRTQFITSAHPLGAVERARFDSTGSRILGAVCTSAPISVEDDVWIGAGVIVLPGVTIGARSVIGAGSVVTRSIPPDSVAVGTPCRVVRQLS